MAHEPPQFRTQRPLRLASVAIAAFALGTVLACARSVPAIAPSSAALEGATLAQVYFWRARPEKLAEYSRYVREVAEPIDREAQRSGAFLSVTTFQAADTTVAWTHMRVFLLRDSAQWRGLSAALAAAGVRVEPDSVRRRQKSAYAATLRDPAGATITQLLR